MKELRNVCYYNIVSSPSLFYFPIFAKSKDCNSVNLASYINTIIKFSNSVGLTL